MSKWPKAKILVCFLRAKTATDNGFYTAIYTAKSQQYNPRGFGKGILIALPIFFYQVEDLLAPL